MEAKPVARLVRCCALLGAVLIVGCSSVPETGGTLPTSPLKPQPPYVPPPPTQVPVVIFADFLSGPYPADGGTASVLRSDTVSQSKCAGSPCVVTIVNSGTDGYFAGLSLPSGPYVVTYTPPSGYRMAAGALDPQTLSVPAASSQQTPLQLTFYVTP